MIQAILTIDDIPSKNTIKIVDYLNQNGIQAIMFSIGKYLDNNFEEAIYAIQHGMIIGNHSFSHVPFSSLSYDECISQIQKCENKIEELYKIAKIKREFKIFRFPFGDKGGENKELLQKFFKENNFDKVDDSKILYDWYDKSGLHKDIDTLWTYDFEEFKLQHDDGFSIKDVFNKMNEKNPSLGAPLFLEKDCNAFHILLMHAHDETEKLWPNYYKSLIDYLLEKGVSFENPNFISCSL